MDPAFLSKAAVEVEVLLTRALATPSTSGLVVLGVSFLAGVHALWTHLVAAVTLLLIAAHEGSEEEKDWTAVALGVATVMWVSITIGWYGCLISQRKHDFVGRAMTGWAPSRAGPEGVLSLRDVSETA